MSKNKHILPRRLLPDFPIIGRPIFMIDDPTELAALPEPAPKRGRRLIEPGRALVEAAYQSSVSPEMRRRLNRARGLAIVVTVPGPSWVQPFSEFLTGIIEATTYSRDGSDRKHLPSVGNDSVATELSNGKNLIGVSQAPERLLPELLMASADVLLTIAPPNAAVVAKAMRRCLRGRVPRDLPVDLESALDLDQIVAALRKGSRPSQAITRLQHTTRKRVAAVQDPSLPRLEDCHFYGEARTWGLALAKDVEAANRGAIQWNSVDRACVLHGASGVGKSVLCRMIAAACKLPIIEFSVAELFATGTGFYESVIRTQRSIFAKAAASRPCILFLDEVDAIPNRMTLEPRNRDYWMPIVNDFLVLLASAPDGLITLAATNRLDALDPALMRPGRLERAIEITPPSTPEGLASILRFHLGSDLPNIDLIDLARLGTGATPATVMDWVRGARRSARAAGRQMTPSDLFAAIVPPDGRSRDVLHTHAIHEAGHAIALLVLGLQRVGFVSLVRDRISNGRLTMDPSAQMGRTDREELEKHAVMLLSGRAAEIVTFGRPSAGAGGNAMSDLGRATKLIAGIHTSFGLGEFLTFRMEFEKAGDVIEYDRELRALVESELRRVQGVAVEIAKKHRRAIEAVACALLEKKFLDGDEVRRLFEDASRNPVATPAACDQSVEDSGSAAGATSGDDSASPTSNAVIVIDTPIASSALRRRRVIVPQG